MKILPTTTRVQVVEARRQGETLSDTAGQDVTWLHCPQCDLWIGDLGWAGIEHVSVEHDISACTLDREDIEMKTLTEKAAQYRTVAAQHAADAAAYAKLFGWDDERRLEHCPSCPLHGPRRELRTRRESGGALMMTLRDKAFSNAAEAQRMTELGLYALAQYHWRTAARQFRQWSAQLAEHHRRLRAENRRVAAAAAKRATEVPF